MRTMTDHNGRVDDARTIERQITQLRDEVSDLREAETVKDYDADGSLADAEKCLSAAIEAIEEGIEIDEGVRNLSAALETIEERSSSPYR